MIYKDTLNNLNFSLYLEINKIILKYNYLLLGIKSSVLITV